MTPDWPSMGDVRTICQRWSLGYFADDIHQTSGGTLMGPRRKLTEREAFCLIHIWAVLYTPEFRAGSDVFQDYEDESIVARLVQLLVSGRMIAVAA